MSNTPPAKEARIEAVAKVLLRWPAVVGDYAGYEWMAEVALEAADAVSAPRAAALEAALRDLVEVVVDPKSPAYWSTGVPQARIDAARELLAADPSPEPSGEPK